LSGVSQPEPATSHLNNIGFLRLLFASLVIIGHAPEMIDGNRLREPLTMIFHTLSLGEISVDAFFLLSGYLIMASMLRSGTIKSYLKKRILRIYPGYLLVMLLILLVMQPALGIPPAPTATTLLRLALLQPPPDTPQLVQLHYKFLDGAIWTIAYEFRCYLFIALLYAARLLGNRPALTLITALLVAANCAISYGNWQLPLDRHIHNSLLLFILGYPSSNIRLLSCFMVGVMGFQFDSYLRRRINRKIALFCTLIMCVFMFSHNLSEVFCQLFGGLALYWTALKADLGWLQKINNSWDISYGTYLYGWPIASTLILLDHNISPLSLAAMTLPLAYIFGCVSWFLVERPVQTIARQHITGRRLPA
jgi:peptidoglycan/LPS O-acetylase OafA/YrhL